MSRALALLLLLACSLAASAEDDHLPYYRAKLERLRAENTARLAASPSRTALVPGVGRVLPAGAASRREAKDGTCAAYCNIGCDGAGLATCRVPNCSWRIRPEILLSARPSYPEVLARYGPTSPCTWVGETVERRFLNELVLRAGFAAGAYGSPSLFDGNPTEQEIFDLETTTRRGTGEYALYLPRPPADRDGDGVPDTADACPTVAGPPPSGCPAPTCTERPAPRRVPAAELRAALARLCSLGDRPAVAAPICEGLPLLPDAWLTEAHYQLWTWSRGLQ